MSIFNDCRRYSANEQEREEWESEMKAEFKRQENYDRQCEERMMCDYESEDNEE